MMSPEEFGSILGSVSSKFLNGISEILSKQQEDLQSYMTKFPDDRKIMITFKDYREDFCTYCTSDTFHLYYNKDFVYVQDELNNTMKIIPMRNIDSIDDFPINYDDDLPFDLGDPEITSSLC